MKEHDGKREIEAVCDTFEGGLIGYLTWKLRIALGLEDTQVDTEGIGTEEFEDDEQDLLDIEFDMSDMDDLDCIWC